MYISELITRLQQMRQQHGEVEVLISNPVASECYDINMPMKIDEDRTLFLEAIRLPIQTGK